MTDKSEKIVLGVALSPETLERIQFLSRQDGKSIAETAANLLADEAEAQAGLSRGPFSRKYMYRA